MPKYLVNLETGASLGVRVEAEDKEEAIEKAFEENNFYICAQCSGWGRGYSFDLGEWDLARGEDGNDAEWAVELIEDA